MSVYMRMKSVGNTETRRLIKLNRQVTIAMVTGGEKTPHTRWPLKGSCIPFLVRQPLPATTSASIQLVETSTNLLGNRD